MIITNALLNKLLNVPYGTTICSRGPAAIKDTEYVADSSFDASSVNPDKQQYP